MVVFSPPPPCRTTRDPTPYLLHGVIDGRVQRERLGALKWGSSTMKGHQLFVGGVSLPEFLHVLFCGVERYFYLLGRGGP